MTDKPRYTMQILDGNGRVIKSETFEEIEIDNDNGKIRTITLLPGEKKMCQKNYNRKTKKYDENLINYILESRGLKIEEEQQIIVDNILILGPQTSIDKMKGAFNDILEKDQTIEEYLLAGSYIPPKPEH